MSKNKKTFYSSLYSNLRDISHNKSKIKVKNNYMEKTKKNISTINKTDATNNEQADDCLIHVMPPSISDEDINALFNGIVNVMRKKIELEARSELINMSVNVDKLSRELKEKKAECVRLKNEIIYLKSQIHN